MLIKLLKIVERKFFYVIEINGGKTTKYYCICNHIICKLLYIYQCSLFLKLSVCHRNIYTSQNRYKYYLAVFFYFVVI